MNIVVFENAGIQISKAAQWFFEQNPGLETKFLLVLDKSIRYIKNNPL
ncbi:hypothetical protein Pedsa_3034 [Pseudopedobacter saltans DSM 12145]|uniref:Uncharacterized protein n=1 Tax=Pseudopedobacter saltans (strain ATCC 51119 / DSM 12145 / JCM 21818 / CCUG 39354 / LMG 10337 / NBRC 100064 / NCIMB 13643) TaxID=762903 RepID=F0S9M0_PSESL|nr:hypothetical protein [Pseudopedobacter saltans]ADY53573.1 hypothetical protein Pedsa_3034 [Pseudopedobacter saltans DSM 12145]